MDSVIYKFPLKLVDEQFVEMPRDAEVLSVGVQNESIMVWAVCDPKTTRLYPRKFYVFGTGNPANVAGKRFVGTVFTGPFVWHVFEESHAAKKA